MKTQVDKTYCKTQIACTNEVFTDKNEIFLTVGHRSFYSTV